MVGGQVRKDERSHFQADAFLDGPYGLGETRLVIPRHMEHSDPR
jgi:hypothetical protein